MIKNVFLLLVLLLSSVIAKSQDNNNSAARITAIRQSFSVSKEKAEEIILALDFNQDKVLKASASNTSPKLKHELLATLLQERQQRLKEVLTPVQFAQLNELLKPEKQKASQIKQETDEKYKKASPRSLKRAEMERYRNNYKGKIKK